MSDLFTFAATSTDTGPSLKGYWKILIIDDDESIHDISNVTMKNMLIDGKGLKLYSAYNASEAKSILAEHDDIAMAFVDVVMETPTAGLDLVTYIREEISNDRIRLIIRTGQPNDAPARHIIDNYDINDYKEKTELTMDRMYITIRSSLRQYHHIMSLNDKYEDFYHKMMISPLTHLPNRTKLNEALDANGNMNLILINVCNFSNVNRDKGFELGDEVLREIAKILNDEFSQNMKIFHLEADHFAMLSHEDISRNDIKQLQENVQQHISKIMGVEIKLVVQMGAVLGEIGNLIQKAEYALHEVKEKGNMINIYGAG